MPVMKNCRVLPLAKTRPSGPVSVAKKPMMNEPVTLTTNVPQGNVAPIWLATTPEMPEARHAAERAAQSDEKIQHHD